MYADAAYFDRRFFYVARHLLGAFPAWITTLAAGGTPTSCPRLYPLVAASGIEAASGDRAPFRLAQTVFWAEILSMLHPAPRHPVCLADLHRYSRRSLSRLSLWPTRSYPTPCSGLGPCLSFRTLLCLSLLSTSACLDAVGFDQPRTTCSPQNRQSPTSPSHRGRKLVFPHHRPTGGPTPICFLHDFSTPDISQYRSERKTPKNSNNEKVISHEAK